MLWVILSFLGALVATFWLSRVTMALVPGDGTGSIALAHVASFVLLALAVGIGKAYFSPFAFDAGLVFISPQLLWFLYDYIRRP